MSTRRSATLSLLKLNDVLSTVAFTSLSYPDLARCVDAQAAVAADSVASDVLSKGEV
jgi:hypothetical protein